MPRCGILRLEPAIGGPVTEHPASVDSVLITIVLATLAIGLPVLVLLSVRFLWNRSLNLGRSKELERLIWQLQRIASAMERQMNLSFPAVQPGTKEPPDLPTLQEPASQPSFVAQSEAIPNDAASATQEPPAEPPVAPELGAHPAPFPPLAPGDPSASHPRRGGVNSMFGL